MFAVTVDLPTPPFPDVITMILANAVFLLFNNKYGLITNNV